MIDRFDNLRCRFVVINEEPFQVIDEQVKAPTQTWDVRQLAEPESAAQEIISKVFEKAFDLEQDCLCRFGLIQIADDQWEWFWVVHHLVNDGWGSQMAMQYMAEVYLYPEAATKPVEVSWAQTVTNALTYRGSDAYLKDQQYWQTVLANVDSVCSLANNPIPFHVPHVPAHLSYQLSRDQYDRIVATGHRLGATPFSVFVAIYAVYLSRITGQSDICLSMPTLGRDKQARLAGGMMSNPVVLRIAIQPYDSFGDIIRQASGLMRGVLRHSRYPAYDIKHIQNAESGVNPLNLCIHHDSFVHELNFGTLEANLKTIKTGPVGESALRIYDKQDDGPIELKFEYESDYFNKSSIVKHLDRLNDLLKNPPELDSAIVSINIIQDKESKRILEQSQGNVAPLGQSHTTLPELFEQQVVRKPEATALMFGEATLTYAELDARSNQLARHLIGLGIGPEQIVALALPRSCEMIVAFLAVLKSGAAYLPLDPDYPATRMAFMLSDSDASLLITQTGVIEEALNALQASNTAPPVLELNNAFTQATLAALNQAPVTQAERTIPLTTQNLAYLIYTSGSTGTPKGAGNTHQGAGNLVDELIRAHGHQPIAQVLQFASFGFDACFSEIMPALSSGATLHLIDDAAVRTDPKALGRFIAEHKITLATLPPVILPEIPLEDLVSLQTLVVAGEVCSPALVKRHAEHCNMLNGYGPTEASVCVTIAGPLDPQMDAGALVPIGRPIQNTQIYILDASLSPLPIGVAGELYISGAGLARGYLGRAGLTAERFVANPFTPGVRMYRSGDLARWTEDGVLEYLGRVDAQVKIRGFRIELGEIEAALLAIPGVAQCTVQARGEDGAKQLVAYLVAGAGGAADASIPETSVLRSTLATALPDYMVPAAFVVLESLPLTPNGKLDVRALPAPEITGEGEYRAPVTEYEQLVASLFTELTGAKRVGLDDSFFALGGHSLLAMRLLSQIRTRTGLELSLRALFEQPTVVGLAQALEEIQSEAQALAASGAVSISRPPIVAGQGVVDPEAAGTQRVLSYGQIRLWTLEQIQGISGNYNMPAALRLSGVLQSEALGLALADVIQRHEPLRTVIANVDGAPVGYVRELSSETTLLAHEDLSSLQESVREVALEQLIARDSTTPFNLSHDLMLRARLIKLADTEHVLTLVMHHIAGDGVSMGVFCQELTQAYQARTQGLAPDWTPLSVSYADHAAWQRAWLEDSGELARQSQSWQAQLAAIPERLSLPTDYPRDANRSRAARYLPIEISAQTTAHLQSLANRHQTTLFTVLVALYGTLLGRLANQSEVVIGSPVAGRTTPEVDGLIGFFINTLALRVDASGHPDLNTLIERVKGSVNHALAHQELPFERLVEDLGVTRSLSHTPVFQAMLAWQTQQAPALVLGHLAIDSMPVALTQTKFDLTLSLAPEPDGAIRGMLEYDASLFSESRVAQCVTWLVRILDQTPALSAATTPVDTLSLLDDAERLQVLELFNHTEVSAEGLAEDARLNDSTTLPELFGQQVLRTPEATALVFGEESLTYAELDARANQLARHLISLGIGPEQIVALALPRSVEMVVALLAVLKSGAAYLPLDPDYPTARLAFMLGDSSASLLITQAGVIKEALDALQESGTTLPILELNNASTQATLAKLDQRPITQAERVNLLTSQNLAYLIYTSGSTGTPKGVKATHSSMSHLVRWMVSQYWPKKSEVRMLTRTSISFDASVWEIFSPLISGASVVMADGSQVKDEVLLAACIAKGRVTDIQTPPSVLPLFNSSELKGVRFYLGGEPVTSAHASILEAAGVTRIVNLYGPTETTVQVVTGVLDSDTLKDAAFGIGTPIASSQIYILDESFNPLPVGVTGELYIAGVGLARGYLGRAGLTAERFVANPFTSGTRMYRSGDLACWTENGVLEYLGRADAQVKIRGFRIELGEIEAALVSIPGVAQCTVQARGEDGAKQLVAYLVGGAVAGVAAGTGSDATIPETSVLRSTLATALPDYMVPAAFVVLESLPLTPNGKLDVRALPAPEITGEGEYRAPVTEYEQLVASLFTELTGAKRVGLDDSFFALGGHSLLAMRLISQIRTRTGLELALRTIFEYPTVEGLASQFKELPTQSTYQPLLPLNKKGSLPPLFCFPPAGGVSTVYKMLSDKLGKEHPLWGLQARVGDNDEKQINQTVSEVAQTYVKAIKELQPNGPYYLVGYSIGGTIAHEAAVQLEESGNSVAALFLLDTASSYPQPESDSKSESNRISELLIGLLKETTDHDLPPAFDDMLTLFQRKSEELGVIPAGTPKSYVLGILKNIVQSDSLKKNHTPKKCQAKVIYFRARQFTDQNTPSDDFFNWQPYTEKLVSLYEVQVSHAQMLWQPVSVEFIANKVHEMMGADAK